MKSVDEGLLGERRAAAGHECGTAEDRYDVLGYLAHVRTPGEVERRTVRTLMRGFGPVPVDGAKEASPFALEAADSGTWRVRTGSRIVQAGKDLIVAVATLEWEIISAALEARRDLFHLHGSALCLPAKPAGLVLVGGSGRGKTTLTMGLMLRGFVPFADDVALLDAGTLELRALRRAFHVGERTWQLLEPLAGALALDDDRLPGYFSPPQWAEHPVSVRWLLCPEFRPGQKAALIPMSPSEAASTIVGHTTSLARTPRVALATAARLTAQAACYRLLCGDLPESVAAIQHLVSGSTASHPPAPRG